MTQNESNDKPKITEQVGTDLMQAGKDQIRSRFRNIFYWPESQPTKIGDTITFPTMGDYNFDSKTNTANLADKDGHIRILLDAITLWGLNRTKQPEGFLIQMDNWQHQLQFSIYYFLLGEPDVSVRFYENECVELFFLKEVNAKQFWDTSDYGTFGNGGKYTIDTSLSVQAGIMNATRL